MSLKFLASKIKKDRRQKLVELFKSQRTFQHLQQWLAIRKCLKSIKDVKAGDIFHQETLFFFQSKATLSVQKLWDKKNLQNVSIHLIFHSQLSVKRMKAVTLSTIKITQRYPKRNPNKSYYGSITTGIQYTQWTALITLLSAFTEASLLNSWTASANNQPSLMENLLTISRLPLFYLVLTLPSVLKHKSTIEGL